MRILSLHLLFFTLLLFNCNEKSNTDYSAHNISLDNSISTDSSVVNFYLPFKKKLQESLMNKPLAYSLSTYKKNDGNLNSSLGNMFADATFELINPIFKKTNKEDIDIVLLNNGGIRSIISKGPISEKTAFELMPFENSIVIVKLNGESLQKMIKYLIKVKQPHPIRGLDIILNKDYSLKSLLINNEEFDSEKFYYVATTDYLLGGGDKMYFLAESKETTVLDYKMRDVLINYFKKIDTLKLSTDNRFIIQ